MTALENILKKNGPMLSSELARQINLADNTSINTASQRIARTKEIKKVKGFFVSRQSLCYLPEHEENGMLNDVLFDSFYENGKKYWYCLNALNMHSGIVSRKFLECYTNYPIKPLKGHLLSEIVMQKFVSQGILIFNGDDYILSPKFYDKPVNPVVHRTIETIKIEILESFNSLARNTGLISYHTGAYFAEFGKFRWGFKGVSTVTGLMQNDKPGFVLADILLGVPIKEKDVHFFIEKINHIQSFKNRSRIIPVLIVDDLEKEALNLLKQKGIVIGFIKELFGNKYAEALKELITVLSNAGASLKKTPDKYLDLISELKRFNEGLVNNIRGTLFEYMVGHIHSVDCQRVDLGIEVIENNGRHEMDVRAVYNNEIVIAECKATKAPIDIDVINKWTREKIPAFRKWVQRQEIYRNMHIRFEFWSTSGFTDEALEALKEFSESVTKFKVIYYQGNQMREKVKAMKNKKLREALDNFFLKSKV